MDLITGKWIGEYVYGDSYENELRGKAVKFSIELFSDGELIRGTCIDEETHALFREPATIEGSFENDAILFYKTYPGEDDLIGASRLIAREYNRNRIQYTGILMKRFFTGTHYFKGAWEINGSFLDKNGTAIYYESDGTWSMKKV
jgi:hypothetical protein